MDQFTFEDFVSRVESGDVRIGFQLVVGRGGSLFLHSLMDNHQQVLSYPGMLNFYESIAPRLNSESIGLKQIISEELSFWNEIMMPYNVQSHLGKEKNISIPIDCEKIAEMTLHTAGTKVTDRKILFLALNFAIGRFFNRDMSQVRMIYCQEHTSHPSEKLFRNALTDFPDARFICMLRDPRANYISIKGWEEKRYSMNVKAWEVQQFQPDLFVELCIYWYSNMLKFASRFQQNFFFIRLEDLQADRDSLLKKLVDFFQLEYSGTLEETTFQGALWHGDNFSPRQPGFRTSANPSKWQTELPVMKQVIIEIILKKELKALNYMPGASRNPFLFFIGWLLFPVWLWDDFGKIFRKNFYVYESQKGYSPLRAFLFVIKNQVTSSFSLLKFIIGSGRKYPEASKLIFDSK
ncbi:MAG: sulfotransferase [Bacteroidota bacterium]